MCHAIRTPRRAPRASPRLSPALGTLLAALLTTTVASGANVTSPAACTITLTASPSTPTPACAPLTLTAAVAHADGSPAAGDVTFYANGRAVSASVALVGGSSSAVIASLTPEAYTLTAAFTPVYEAGATTTTTPRCAAGVSAALSHGVRKASPTLTVTPVPSTLTPPADCDITRAQFWVAATPPAGCPPPAGGLVAYLVPGRVRAPAVWRPLAPPSAADAARLAAAVYRDGSAAVTGGVAGLVGGGGAAAAVPTATTPPPPPSLVPGLAAPAGLADIVRAAQAGYAAGRQAQQPAVAARSEPPPATDTLAQPPPTSTPPPSSLTMSLLTHRPDARVDAGAASAAAHAGSVTAARPLDRRRLAQQQPLANATAALADATAGSPLGHVLLGAAPLVPSSVLPGSVSRGGITPAAGGAPPPGAYTVVVQYSGDPNYEAGAAGAAFGVDGGCVGG